MNTNIIETGNLTQKELKDSDLVTLHRSLFESFIKEHIHKLAIRKTVIKLYDATISTENIRLYYNRHIALFTKALVSNRLEDIAKHSTF